MARPASIPDEISEFLHRNAERINRLPQIINIAFSGERKPEAWHVRISNRQVSRGFNKSAPVTIMLSLKSWRKLMKKNDQKLWQNALTDGQIHVHGDAHATNSILQLFNANGDMNNVAQKTSEAPQDSLPESESSSSGKAKPGRAKKTKTTRKSKAKAAKASADISAPE